MLNLITDLVEVHNGHAVTTSHKVAKVFELDHDNVIHDIDTLQCSQNFKEDNFKRFFEVENKPIYQITKDGFTMLAMGYNNEKAMQFRERYIQAFNEMESKPTSPPVPEEQLRLQSLEQELKFKRDAAAMQTLAGFLNVSDSGKLLMAQKLCESNGITTTMLPEYVEAQVSYALSDLIKKYRLNYSAQKINKLLLEHGFLQTNKRTGKSGKEKTFKSITDKGLKYGENKQHPQSPSEVQPHWYDSRFKELMTEILVTVE